MTTEPNIRERLARAALKGWANAVMKGEPSRWNAAVDAILAELEKPSEGMLDAAAADGFDEDCWQAMIQHIRDGGK